MRSKNVNKSEKRPEKKIEKKIEKRPAAQSNGGSSEKICPVFKKCGGCQYQGKSNAIQL